MLGLSLVLGRFFSGRFLFRQNYSHAADLFRQRNLFLLLVIDFVDEATIFVASSLAMPWLVALAAVPWPKTTLAGGGGGAVHVR